MMGLLRLDCPLSFWKGPIMERMSAFVGMMIGSSVGGWLGSMMHLYMMVILSAVGAGLGFYLGARLVREFLD
jgi:hypothetical protein